MARFNIEPFQTLYRGSRAEVVAYRTEHVYCWLTVLCGTDLLYWSNSAVLNPVPPIPRVALEPKVGEVWILEKLGASLLLGRHHDDNIWRIVLADGLDCRWVSRDQILRIATIEEIKPFQRILLGLETMFGGVK